MLTDRIKFDCYFLKKQRGYSREKALLTLHVVTEMHFLLQKNLKNIMHGRVKMYAMCCGPPGFTCWISFAPVFSLIYC